MRRESLLDAGAYHRAPSSRASRDRSRASADAAPALLPLEPRRVAARPLLRSERGFTLIELMATVIVIAILTAVAYPSYQDYVRRSALADATSTLSDLRVRMERYYQSNSGYGPGGGVCGVADPAATQYFTYTCAPGAGANPQTYTFTATGNSGLTNGFVFTINHQNVRATTGMYASWGALPADAGTRWVLKKP